MVGAREGEKGVWIGTFVDLGHFSKQFIYFSCFFCFFHASLQKQMKAYKTASRIFWKSKTAEIETSEIVKIED